MSIEEIRRSDDARLERIEKKIDVMSDAMISLARAEEKLISFEKNNQHILNKIDRQEAKIDSLEKTITDNNRTIIIINRLFWLILTGAISFIVFKIS